MSGTSTGITRHDRKSAPHAESYVLPERALRIIRLAAHSVSRVFWRLHYKGTENIPATGGLLIAANHQTYIDPIWVGIPVNRPVRFLAWSEIFDWPLVGKLSSIMGAWPLEIERSDPTAVRRSLQWLRDGGAVVIFPEGGRGEADGSMVRFKNGAVRMALEANVPILPVTIRGAHCVWPKGKRLPRLSSVEVIYHPLFHVTALEGEDARVCGRRETDRLAEIIRSAL